MDPVQAFLQGNALTPPAFPATSRYYGIPTSRITRADGRTVLFVQRRFLPPMENFAPLQVVTIVAGDRLDNLAARYLGDPQQSWRLCDANGAMQPEALVVNVGATLTITLPEGVPSPGTGDGL
jgi:hypothetical protein